MAEPPEYNETFLREVDENLRRDQLRDFAKKHGALLAAAVVLFLIASGGFIWWQQHKVQRSEKQVEQLAEVFKNIGAGAPGDAPKQLDEMSDRGSKGVRATAMFTRAALALQQNDVKLATAKYREIAGDSSLPRPYRDAALLRQTALEFEFASAAGGHLAASAAGETRHALVRHRGRNDRTCASQAEPAGAGRAAVRRDRQRQDRFQLHPRPLTPGCQQPGRRRERGSPSGPVGPTMIKHKSIRIAVMIAVALAASGCSVFKKKGPSTPVLGERIAVLTGETDVEVDPATTALPMSLPQPVVNTTWT